MINFAEIRTWVSERVTLEVRRDTISGLLLDKRDVQDWLDDAVVNAENVLMGDDNTAPNGPALQ